MNEIITPQVFDLLTEEEKEKLKRRVLLQAERMSLGHKISVNKKKRNPETGRFEVVEKQEQYIKPDRRMYMILLNHLFSNVPQGETGDVLGELEDREQWLKSKLKKVKGYKKIYKELEEDVIEGEVIDG